MANKFMASLLKLPGAVEMDEDFKVFRQGIRHPSPSFNFILGNTHLFPFGASIILWGPPKGGKSLISNGLIGQLHKDYPDAIAIKYNTEFREEYQNTSLQRRIWGIDKDRYAAYDTASPKEIFDQIEFEIPKLIQAGANIRLIIIDSISDILGRRAENATTIDTMQRGDEALTIKDGLKRIKGICKKHRITLVLTAQERAEQDPLEIMRGKTTRMAGSAYLKHFAEYFIYVRRDESKDGRVDAMGNDFTVGLKDLNDKNEQVAHKIIVKMQDSSIGPKYRTGEFTLHYYKGIINVHEEIFELGLNRKIVEKPNLRSYVLKDFPEEGKEMKWGSKEDFLNTIRDNDQVSSEIVKRIKQKDIQMMESGIIEDFVHEKKEEVIEE